MQGSFGDIYNKLYEQISQDVAYLSNIINDEDDYEIINEVNEINEEDELSLALINNMNEHDLASSKIEHIIKDQLATFNIFQYLDKIGETFNYNSENMLSQFILDFGRSELYLEGKYIRNKNYFINYIHKHFDYLCNYKDMKMSDMLLMLCNQASFGFPFTLMNSIYSNYNKGLYVLSNTIKYMITTNKKKELCIELKATFNIKNINTNKLKGIINVNTKLDLVFENNIYIFPVLGIIYWLESK